MTLRDDRPPEREPQRRLPGEDDSHVLSGHAMQGRWASAGRRPRAATATDPGYLPGGTCGWPLPRSGAHRWVPPRRAAAGVVPAAA